METPNEVCYLSTVTSPRSICSVEESLNFYSAPTSPIPEASNILFGLETEPATPDRKSEREFVFGTSLEADEVEGAVIPRKHDHHHRRSGGEAKQIMAYADELFCDGRVVPLDPPPCFRVGLSERVAESRSSRSFLGRPISRQCLWNDDFDPFAVALEAVREGKSSRRAPSLSPERAETRGHPASLLEEKPKESVSARWASPTHMWDDEMEKGEPRGVVFARRVRRVKIGQPRLDEEVELLAKRPKENLREKIVRLLFRLPVNGEDRDNRKLEHQNSDTWKRTFLRRMGFRPRRTRPIQQK